MISFLKRLQISSYFKSNYKKIKSERKALFQERTLVNTLMDNIPDHIYFKDLESRFTRINKAQAQYFKLSDPGLAVGKTDFDFFSEEHARQAFDDEQMIIRTGQPIYKEEKETWNVQSDSWVSTVKLPLRDEKGKIIGTFGISRDITNRILAEFTLKEKNEDIEAHNEYFVQLNENFQQSKETIAKERTLLQTLIDNLPSAVFVKDKDYRKIIANKIHLTSMAGHLSNLGLDPNTDIIGKTDFEITSNEWAEKYFVDDQKIIRDGESIINKEEEGFSPEGKRIWLLVSKIPLRDKDGAANGMVAITTDITKLKQAEILTQEKNQVIETQNEEYHQLNEELLQTNDELQLAKERAEESNHLKTAFLHNMSHEIRTPMNSIIGFTELLKTVDLSGEKQEEFIRIIEQGGQRTLSIINNIIDISRIESGQIEISSKEKNVNHLLKQLHALFKPEADGKGLIFTYFTELSDEFCTIETDDIKLTQVLSNLLENALKFTKTGNISFGYYLKKNMLEFYVQDTGKGIPENQKDIIFERFVQGEMSNTRDFEGAGLGLSISKAYVEKLDGNIWVESKLGKGTTFYFNIPYKLAKSVQIKVPIITNLINSLQSINILITEDDENSMLLMKKILEKEKANLFFANNGQEALDMVKAHSEIQIVLMDLKMPIMDGFEATQLIKNMKPGLPVIAQSAYAYSNDQDKARKAGCDDFIGKPMTRELLLSIIKKQLSK